MKNKRKVSYALILALAVAGGLVFANRKVKSETKPSSKPLSAAEMKARVAEDRKKWEASPDGIMYKAWVFSPEGKKVHVSNEKISKHIKDFSNMEALVTSVTFRRPNENPSASKWLIVRIDGEKYMMQFSVKEFRQLNVLKVNDKIMVRSRYAGYSPNHPYLIIAGDYIEQNNKVLLKRDLSKNNGC